MIGNIKIERGRTKDANVLVGNLENSEENSDKVFKLASSFVTRAKCCFNVGNVFVDQCRDLWIWTEIRWLIILVFFNWKEK